MLTIEHAASSAGKWELCPGSLEACKGIPETKSEPAKSGDRIHHALYEYAVGKVTDIDSRIDLSDRERQVANWFKDQVVKTCRANGGVASIHAEQTSLWQITPELQSHITPDLVISMKDGTRHIFDYKSGRAEVHTSDDNRQVQSYALHDWLENDGPADRVVHVLSAGNDSGERHTMTTLDTATMIALEGYIPEIFIAAVKPGAKRELGFEQCRYCLAAGTERCPESIQAVEKFAANAPRMQPVDAVLGAMTPDQCSEAYKKVALVASIADKVKTCLKNKMMEWANPSGDTDWDAEGCPMTGWEITKGSVVRSIPDDYVDEAYRLLNEHEGITPDQFRSIVSVKRTKIEGMVHAVRCEKAELDQEKAPTKKSTIDDLKTILDPVIIESRKAGSLKKRSE